MALPVSIPQFLLELASQIELRTISEFDARDRVEQFIEILAEYSAYTDTNVDEAALTNLLSVLQRLDLVERGRPAIKIPFQAIESYLLHGFKVTEIAKLFGVTRQTIHRRMQNKGLS